MGGRSSDKRTSMFNWRHCSKCINTKCINTQVCLIGGIALKGKKKNEKKNIYINTQINYSLCIGKDGLKPGDKTV